MKTITCVDCGVEVELLPNGHNRERCLPCAAIQKAETDKKYGEMRRKLNPGYSCQHLPYNEYETWEDKVRKVTDTWTWPKLDFNQTPMLDMLIQHNIEYLNKKQRVLNP